MEEPNSSPNKEKCKDAPGEWAAGSEVKGGVGDVKLSRSEESSPWCGVPMPRGGSATASQSLTGLDSSPLPSRHTHVPPQNRLLIKLMSLSWPDSPWKLRDWLGTAPAQERRGRI